MAPQVVPLSSEVSPRFQTRDPYWKLWFRKIANSGFPAIFDQGVVSAANFATSVIIGRFGSPNDLGVYYLVLSILYFARGVQDQIVAGPYTIYARRRDEADIARYTGSVLVHQVLLSVVSMGVLGAVWLGVLYGAGPAELAPSLLVLMGMIPFLLLREFVRRISFARFHLGAVIMVDIVVSVLQVGTLAAFAWSGSGISIPGVYLAMGLACAAACLGWFLLRIQPLAVATVDVVADWRENWKFGRWALAGQLVGCSAPLVLPWLVAVGHGAAAAGLMAACNTLVGIANTFVLGFCNHLCPKAAAAYAEGGPAELTRVLFQAAVMFTCTIGGFSVAALLAGDWILVLVYGDEYAGGGSIFAVYALAMWANSMTMTAGNGLWAIDRPNANFVADAASLIAAIIAAIIFVPMWGVFGAALATLAANGLDAFIRFLILGHYLRRGVQAPSIA